VAGSRKSTGVANTIVNIVRLIICFASDFVLGISLDRVNFQPQPAGQSAQNTIESYANMLQNYIKAIHQAQPR
jgi:hypothetical protein